MDNTSMHFKENSQHFAKSCSLRYLPVWEGCTLSRGPVFHGHLRQGAAKFIK